MNKEEIEVKYEINAKDFCKIRESLKWNKLDEKQVEKAINNSMIHISVMCNGKCVGVGRIVGDSVLKGMLTDIMVMKKYQGKGIGKLIVTGLLNKLDEWIKEGEAFQLEANPTFGNREFYIKCGMKYKPQNQDGVYIWINR